MVFGFFFTMANRRYLCYCWWWQRFR